jgi:hypothetical protein
VDFVVFLIFPVVPTLFCVELTLLLLIVPERLDIREFPVGLMRFSPAVDCIDFPDEKSFETERIFDRERAFAATELFEPILLTAGRSVGCLDDMEIFPSRDIPD